MKHEDKFFEGAVVKLDIPCPKMTIGYVFSSSAGCYWFANDEIMDRDFRLSALHLVKGGVNKNKGEIMDNKIKLGDTVALRSGSPSMIVTYLYDNGKKVDCSWFDALSFIHTEQTQTQILKVLTQDIAHDEAEK